MQRMVLKMISLNLRITQCLVGLHKTSGNIEIFSWCQMIKEDMT